jgi:hypothetical protein
MPDELRTVYIAWWRLNDMASLMILGLYDTEETAIQAVTDHLGTGAKWTSGDEGHHWASVDVRYSGAEGNYSVDRVMGSVEPQIVRTDPTTSNHRDYIKSLRERVPHA